MKFTKVDLRMDMPVYTGVTGASLSGIDKYFGTSFAAAGPAEGKTEDDEFAYIPFRCISACMVGGGSYKATDFTNEAVLKKAVPLLNTKPVYKDHGLWSVDNTIGTVVATKWAAAYTDDVGNKIPAGIDGVFRVSKKYNERMAAKLLSNPPEIQSCSVSVQYKFKPSHNFEDSEGNADEWMFERRIGSMINGEMVCRICTEVIDFIEVSTVTMGADPFAKIKDAAGNLVNIDRSAVLSASTFDADPLVDFYKKNGQLFIADAQNQKSFLHLSRFSALNESETMFKEFFSKALNTDPEKITPSFLANFSVVKTSDLVAVQALADEAKETETRLSAEKETLSAAKVKTEADLAAARVSLTATQTNLNKATADLQKEQTYKSGILKARKEAVVSAFGKVSNGTGVDAFRATLEHANEEQVAKFENDYQVAGLHKFGAKCTECGSTEFTMQQSEDPEVQTLKADKPHMAETAQFFK